MKILVTGSNGFVGKHVCQYLMQTSGYYIIGNGRREKPEIKLNQYINKDIADKDFVEFMKKNIDSCDVIVHVAASKNKDNFSDELVMSNCLGTMNIQRLAIELKCKKVIYVSSIPVIGIPKQHPITEKHEIEPKSMYHITKLMGEYMLTLLSQYDIKTVTLRIPSPICTGMEKNTILPIFIEKALKNENLVIYGKGTRKQNYLDVRDLGNAIKICIENLDIEGCFNIASNRTISNYELAELCIKLTNSSSKIVYSDLPDLADNEEWDVDISKAKNILKFIPEYSIEDTLNNIIDNDRWE